jgi:uncharacterized protein with FMN-binding domain
MKKIIIRVTAVIAVLAVIGGMVLYSNLKKFDRQASSLEVHNIDLSKIQDGEYLGEYSLGQLVSASVKVTVKGNKITNIEFIEHNYGLGKKAEVIVDSVIDKQSLAVDVVSGATGSSKVILKAIEAALSAKH